MDIDIDMYVSIYIYILHTHTLLEARVFEIPTVSARQETKRRGPRFATVRAFLMAHAGL